MKKVIFIIAALAIGLAYGYAILISDSGPTASSESDAKQLYTCGMHPEIISEEPGYCPICGMKLTPKKDGGQAMEGSIAIDPTTKQNMGLITTEVRRSKLSKTVRVFGSIEYSQPRIQTVNLKIPGWVEKLYVDYDGAYVKAGQPLLDIYSPELVAAQREYLVAYKNSEIASAGSSQLLNAAVMRLQNWDISKDQITQLNTKGEPSRTMLIRSPFSGVVIAKHINLGDNIKPGMMAYTIADISKLWVTAYVYEQDLPYLKLGQNAEVSVPSLPGKSFNASVSYIAPYLEKNKQIEIRLDIDNPDFALKPGIYAEVNIESSLIGERLAVPSKAVINSGMKQIVYLAAGDDSFMPRVIRTGAYGGDDNIEVISGLKSGDQVVVSGQFLLDSESRLNESLAFTHSHGGGSGDDDDISHDEMKADDNKHDKHDDSELSGIYTCPMSEHYHVLQYGEGKCPECGMNLVPVEETNNTEVYYCPMTDDKVVQNTPGRCPKCGMHLKKLETGDDHSSHDKMTHKAESHEGHDHSMMTHDDKNRSKLDDLSGIYTCPMSEHYHVLQYGEGKCSECGMNLVSVENTDNTEVYHCPMAECGVVKDKPGECPVCGMKLIKLK